MRNVYMAVTQGNVYRDLIRLGMLRHMLDTYQDIRVIILTQAYAVTEVLNEVRHDRVVVARHDMYKPTFLLSLLVNSRKKVNLRSGLDILMSVEKRLAKSPVGLEDLFKQFPPSLVITTHPRICWEWDLIMYSRKKGIPTLGLVKSWDNILRHLYTRTDYLSVWNKVNYQEALTIEKYRQEEIRMVGPVPFDRYYEPSVIRDRAAFFEGFGLDPSKPIIFFGTAGSFTGDWDETFMMDLLLEMVEQDPKLNDVQIICRLHPVSHLEHFWPYRTHPRVRLSFGSYVKTLGWSMTLAEVDEMANFLKHSDIVLTPASTLSLEGPVFDTPTIVTLFSTVRPDLHDRATKKHWLDMHFKPIAENNWLPLAQTPDQMHQFIQHALADKSWYREERKSLVEQYVTLTDGKSYQRVAAYINELAK